MRDTQLTMAELEQILHDPENQPSQFGTVPLAMLLGAEASAAKLAAELAAAQKDAERYREIRSSHGARMALALAESPEELDAAIDKAMKAK